MKNTRSYKGQVCQGQGNGPKGWMEYNALYAGTLDPILTLHSPPDRTMDNEHSAQVPVDVTQKEKRKKKQQKTF